MSTWTPFDPRSEMLESISLTHDVWITRSFRRPDRLEFYSVGHRPIALEFPSGAAASFALGACRAAMLSSRRPPELGGRKVPVTREEMLRYLLAHGEVVAL